MIEMMVDTKDRGKSVPEVFPASEGSELSRRIKDLDRRGVRTKTSRLVDGRVRGGIRFGTGGLAHLLKNRFYIGEVVYRDPLTHAAENIGSTTMHMILVELKK